MSDVDAVRAPCGCEFATIGESFVINPCSETCDTYAYFIEQSRKQGNDYRELDPGELVEKQFAEMSDQTTRCPYCAKECDAVSGAAGRRPTSGAASLCFYCARFAIFDDDLKLRKPTADETQELADDVDLQIMRRAVQISINDRLLGN